MATHHKIVCGDSRKMSLVPDTSVHLVITSPPYWQLKDYGSQNQIGFHDTYENYINNLNLVWRECNRVLHPGCRLCINIGDQFARSVYYGRYKVIPIRTEIIKYCETIGLDYMGAIIWQKKTTTNTTGGASIMGSFPYPRNGILKIDYEFILIFKKSGVAPQPTKEQKDASQLTNEEWNEYFSGHWNFSGVRQKDHLAAFPEELPRRLIRMFSFVGETVLDPFWGSGTTTLAATKLERNSIGYEIHSDYIQIGKTRLREHADLFETHTFEFISEMSEIDFTSAIQSQPYIFKDPLALDKKIDIKKLQFGSKIDKSSHAAREDFFIVREILSPVQLRLSNGLTIKLLGIEENPDKKNEAENYLHKKVLGKRVFLRYDNPKYNEDQQLLVYLYLENKTFINMHLIKQGLVHVSEAPAHRLREKFFKRALEEIQ